MQISSPAFGDNQNIPEKYTCDGTSTSVPLKFSNVPAKAQSLAMIMYDPDVPVTLIPSGMFVHWVVFNIPPMITGLAENQTPPGVQGNNGSGKPVFAGPCPPDKQHRYFFKLYALDAMLNLPAGASKDQVEAAMQGHILDQAQLIGLFNKKSNPQ
jgi:Raf kinase inhibitor-like YbhB/YbcL family protein